MPLPPRIQVQPQFSPCTNGRMKAGVSVPPLSYKLRPVKSSQTRFDGRLLLEPELDLGRYECKAVIDWIWLEFETQRRTGSTNLRDHLKKLFGESHAVLGPDAKHDDEANWNVIDTRFRMKIQDPQPWAVARLEGVIGAFCGLARPIRILGIEIALDWYPNDHSDVARWQMVATLQRHHRPMVAGLDSHDCDLRHTYARTDAKPGDKDKAATEFVIHARRPDVSADEDEGRKWSDLELEEWEVQERVVRVDGHKAPYLDSTVYRGADKGEVLFRIQDKVADQRNRKAGTAKALAQDEKRARLEVRLLEGGVRAAGFGNLAELFGFNFVKLGKHYFAFRLATVPGGRKSDGSGALVTEEMLGKTLCRVFRESGVYGVWLYEEARRERQRAKRRDRRKAGEKLGRAARVYPRKNGHLHAWNWMTKRTGRALASLGEKWAAAMNDYRRSASRNAVHGTGAEEKEVVVGEGSSAGPHAVQVDVDCRGVGSRGVESSVVDDSVGCLSASSISVSGVEGDGAEQNLPRDSLTIHAGYSGRLQGEETAESSAVSKEEARGSEASEGEWEGRKADEQYVSSYESREARDEAAREADDRFGLAGQGQDGGPEPTGAAPSVRFGRGENLSPTADSPRPDQNFGQGFFGVSGSLAPPRPPGSSRQREDVVAEVEHEEAGACARAT